jgi:hypothetical protein
VNYNGLEKHCCPSSLERGVINRLVEELTPVARNAFGMPITKEDVKNHVIPVDTLFITSQEGNVKGFSSYKTYSFEDYSVIYGSGACVLRSEQGKGLYRRFNEEGIRTETDKHKAKKFYFAARTQNPVIYATIGRILNRIYLNEEESPDDICEIARKMAHILGGEIDKEFVMRNAYGSCLYDVIPRYKDEKVNNMFDRLLRYEKGDALLIVGKLK